MRLPLLHSQSHGLYLGETFVCWVTLEGLPARPLRVRAAVEAIEGDDARGAVERLVARLKPASPYVTTHLAPEHVRHAFIRGPMFDEADAEQAWLREQAMRHLPTGADPATFVLRTHRLDQTDDRVHHLIALAPREAIRRRMAMLHSVGLRVLRIGSVEAEVGHVLAFSKGFLDGSTTVLMLHGRQATLTHFVAGRPAATTLLEISPDDAESLALEIDTSLAGWTGEAGTAMPRRLLVAGAGAEAAVATLAPLRSIHAPLRPESQAEVNVQTTCAALPGPFPHRALPIAPLQVPAAALAVGGLFSSLDVLNFMATDEAVTAQAARDRAVTLSTTLLAGLAVAVMMISVLLLGSWVHAARVRTQVTLAQLAGHLDEVDGARADLSRLQQDVVRAERLVTERTHVAGLLAWLGEAVPEGLWLQAFDLTTPETQPPQLHLQGAAYEHVTLALYLQRLEQSPWMQTIRLEYAEAMPARALYREAAVTTPPLLRFSLHLQAHDDTTQTDR